MPAYHLIYNAKAGSANPEQRNAVVQILQSAPGGFQLHDAAASPVELAETAAQDPECQVLIAAGGDGTVSAVAGVAYQRGLIFGVVPAGTLNHFARDAGIPDELEEAARAIHQGQERSIDIMTIGDLICVNNASIGIYPHLVRHREAHESRLGKWPAAALAAVKLLIKPPRRYRLTIQADKVIQHVKTPFVFIGNNNYQTSEGGLGARSGLTSGRLTLFVYQGRRWWELLLGLGRLFAGRPQASRMHDQHPTSITISGRINQLPVAIDGEIHQLPLPLTATIQPGKLRIILPRASR